MVYARLDKLEKYLDSDTYSKISAFVQEVDESTAEGKYEIYGDKVFARVMSYDTSLPKECKIEAHNKYIDIQVTITGAEGISVYDRKGLTESISYNEHNDVVFFDVNGAISNVHTVNVPGYFTMLNPEDAHRPQERVGNIDKVKKYVIKVAV